MRRPCRVQEIALAREIRYIDRLGSHIWLDPTKPSELEARLRELDRGFTGVKVLGIGVRTDDTAVSIDLLRRTMERPQLGAGATSFLTAAERFFQR